jgi:hypothetical protein
MTSPGQVDYASSKEKDGYPSKFLKKNTKKVGRPCRTISELFWPANAAPGQFLGILGIHAAPVLAR